MAAHLAHGRAGITSAPSGSRRTQAGYLPLLALTTRAGAPVRLQRQHSEPASEAMNSCPLCFQ
eukprot:6765100-Heterocapsa_arctica.AAC.1